MSSTYAAPLDMVERGLDDLAQIAPEYRTTTEKRDVLVRLSRIAARAEAERMRVLAAADDIAVETGARSTAHWLADATRDNPGAVRRLSALAEALDERWTESRHGVGRRCQVNVAQARVIAEALDALPAGLEPETLAKAEAYLLGEAARFGPPQLRRLAHSLLEVIAPEIADEAEYKRLVEEEKRARAATTLSFQRRGDGATDIRARIPDHVANRLKTYLDAYTSPRRGPLGDVDQLPVARRRGIAFCALLENLPAHGLPQHGGTATTVMVILDFDTLKTDAGSGIPPGPGSGSPRRRPGTGAPPNKPDGSPARQASSPSSSAAEARSSTSAAPDASSPPRSGRRWPSGTAHAPPTAARSPPPGAKPTTTSNPGPKAAEPTSPTASSSAPSTTTAPTTQDGTPTTTPTDPRPSTGGRESESNR